MNSLISIVVPIYNVEIYLDRCLQSICNQTYRNIEVILVDDGSPDSSGDIAERYAEQDSRIKVYHKKNGGLSDARNFGLSKSTGDYVTYIDSDDYITDDYIEILASTLEQNNAEISAVAFYRWFGGEEIPLCANAASFVDSGSGACLKMLRKYYEHLVSACGKLYKKDILENHLFPVGKLCEDEATVCKLLYDAKKVVFSNKICYIYRWNPTSISATKASTPYMLWSLQYRAEYFEKRKEYKLARYAWKRFYGQFFNDSVNNNSIDETIDEGLKTRHLLLETRLLVVVYKYCFNLFKSLWDVKRKIKTLVAKVG